MGDIDVEHFTYLMRYVFENQEQAKSHAMLVFQEILSCWTWRKVAEKMKERLESNK